MNRRNIILGAASLVILAGCTTAAPLIITNSSAAAKNASQVRKAIFLAGASRGWIMKDVDSSTIQASYTKAGKHTAVVDITYSVDSYTITPNKKSSLMLANGQVDRHLNRWIRNLDQSIQKQLVLINLNDKL